MEREVRSIETNPSRGVWCRSPHETRTTVTGTSKQNSSRRTSITTLFIRHQVTNYPDWRKVYDDVHDMQQRLGVTGSAVYQDDEDGNTVTVAHDFASSDAAKQFLGSSDLRQAMDRAGVAGEPTIWFANKV